MKLFKRLVARAIERHVDREDAQRGMTYSVWRKRPRKTNLQIPAIYRKDAK